MSDAELEAIRARHDEEFDHVTVAGYGLGRCNECSMQWPCDTVQVLARLDAAEARLAEVREALGHVIDEAEGWRNRCPNARLGRWLIRDLRALLAEPTEGGS